MSKPEKKRLVPALRFPEFRDQGEWKEEKVGTVAALYKGKGISKAEIVANGVRPCIRYGELYTIYGEAIHEVVSRTNVDGSELFLSKKNDVIIPASGETKIDIAKASCVMSDDVALGGDLNVIRSSLNGIFLSYQLNGPLRFSIAKVAQGDTVVHLYPTQIERLDVLVPCPIEQQKIADCLTSVDELITFQTQKLDTLKAHKKGLMQQLFPRDGETVPKLRFPEFRDKGEWKEMQIGDLNPFVTSGSRGWATYYANQGSLFVRITNLTREFIYLDLTDKKFVKLPQEASEGVRTQLKEFDVLISITADIGIIGYVDANVPSPAYINQHIALVRFDTSQVNSKFVSYFLASERSQRLFRASSDTGTKAGMSLIVVQKILVALPTVPEQQKIADCLATLDGLITAQTEKLTALKTHKKGLMQQLFPSVGGVAGEA